MQDKSIFKGLREVYFGPSRHKGGKGGLSRNGHTVNHVSDRCLVGPTWFLSLGSSLVLDGDSVLEILGSFFLP